MVAGPGAVEDGSVPNDGKGILSRIVMSMAIPLAISALAVLSANSGLTLLLKNYCPLSSMYRERNQFYYILKIHFHHCVALQTRFEVS